MVLYGPGPQLPIFFPESGFVKPLHFVGSRYSGLPFCRLIMADHQASLFIPFQSFSILVSRGMERIFEGVFLKAVFAWQDWNGWSRGFARCSELTIEQWFGQLRVQMASAQFTARQVLASSGAPAAENRKGAEPPQASYRGTCRSRSLMFSASFLMGLLCPLDSLSCFVNDCQFPEES